MRGPLGLSAFEVGMGGDGSRPERGIPSSRSVLPIRSFRRSIEPTDPGGGDATDVALDHRDRMDADPGV